MGAVSCSNNQKGCCASNSGGANGPGAPEEYKPDSADASVESLESKPSSVLPADRGGGRQEEDSEHGTNESYFVMELQELEAMAASGPDGERPAVTFSTGATYTGQWAGSRRHGRGSQSWPDGATFCGEWRDSAAHGLGKFVHADSDVYIGEWKANAAQGRGVYYHARGLMTYTGEWHEDRQHGLGMEQWKNGSRYTGHFLRGKKHGLGLYEWPDGSKFAGHWHSNSPCGHGVYSSRDGRTFYGLWKDPQSSEAADADPFVRKGRELSAKLCGVGARTALSSYKWEDGPSAVGFWKGVEVKGRAGDVAGGLKP